MFNEMGIRYVLVRFILNALILRILDLGIKMAGIFICIYTFEFFRVARYTRLPLISIRTLC